MPTGFFTVEQWRRGKTGAGWAPVLHLDAYQSLSRAIQELEKRGRPGLYRVVQTQRCVWAQMEDGKVHLHRSHVSSAGGLTKLTELFEKEKGRRPVEKARQERVRAKRNRRQ